MVPEPNAVNPALTEKGKSHYQVMWVYCGFAQTIRDMYDKPYALCRWWVKQHQNDPQYARGKFLIVAITHNPVLS